MNTKQSDEIEDFAEEILRINQRYGIGMMAKLKIKDLLTTLRSQEAKRVEDAVKAERERILRVCDTNAMVLDEEHEDMVVYLADIEKITGVSLQALTDKEDDV